MGYWDDNEDTFKMPSSNYFKFDNVGDEVKGEIVDIGSHTFPNETDPTPKLFIKVDGEEEPVEVTCGARNLKTLVLTERPDIGDMVRIKLTGIQGQTKVYVLDVKRADKSSAATSEEDIFA